jgi:cbb3-type cytochrome oxidase subunit 3
MEGSDGAAVSMIDALGTVVVFGFLLLVIVVNLCRVR